VSEQPTGLLVVDKPGGMTSHDVVARVRRILGTRRVGHAGTLDPMATGVLVLGVGRATRLLGYLSGREKSYVATIRLGAATTTDDAEGELLATGEWSHLMEADVRQALAGFVGEQQQVPSSVSAVKVDGRRSYQLVREGEPVALAPRRVTIHELVVRAVRLPDVEISLRCSSGTYVRAVARDLGAGLGVGGHLVALRRTAVGPFGLTAARSLDDLARDPRLLPLSDGARAAFPSRQVDADQASAIGHGRRLALALPDVTAMFAPDGEFLALYGPVTETGSAAPGGSGWARPVAVFAGRSG
jgi:tRNA pseudouridine55 synthase